MSTRRRHGGAMVVVLLALFVLGGMLMFLSLTLSASSGSGASACSGSGVETGLLSAAGGTVVGATEYGGPGDPSSGTVGSSGTDLNADPDSYAELGGTSFATATAMGGLSYGTQLRITWGGHSLIARKEDIGLGGGPIQGHARAIDLWWQLAGRLGIPYENGLWSGLVRVERPPGTGSAATLGESPGSSGAGAEAAASEPVTSSSSCASGGLSVGTVPGSRAKLLSDGQAVAPADAPAVVKQIIAAGNQIVGKPYVYGGGHGLPLSEISSAYDCSSSVSHLLWGGGLLGAGGDLTSGEFESWGDPGPGKWVTLYASAGHVFMYVAGLRWDTHDAAGPGDGSSGIGWHPLVREADGFVARHPPGL